MDHYQIVSNRFQATIEAIAESVDLLSEPLSHGGEAISQALLEDRKILACGNGQDAALASLLVSNLLNRFERERPALPALALATDSASLTAIARDEGLDEIFSRQVRALGGTGDILLCIASEPAPVNLQRAVSAAHERNMTVIVLSTASDARLPGLLVDGDIALVVDCDRHNHVVELQLMLIHTLCELIDHNIFGLYDGNTE